MFTPRRDCTFQLPGTRTGLAAVTLPVSLCDGCRSDGSQGGGVTVAMGVSARLLWSAQEDLALAHRLQQEECE